MDDPFPQNGLLPRRSDLSDSLTIPQVASPEQKLRSVIAEVMGLVDANRVAWTAILDDELIPPPGAHVLDQLVRMEFSGTTAEIEAELLLHPRAGTVAVMHRLPQCDLCALAGRHAVEARYDAPTTDDGTGPWGYMCPACYRLRSTGRLGNSLGQYLMQEEEVPDDVWEALDRARGYWRSRLSGPP
jgi:hypothetical protein